VKRDTPIYRHADSNDSDSHEMKRCVMAVDTVVLVHGAFADGSCWAKVIPLLRPESPEADPSRKVGSWTSLH
jgi:hypothetical protein